MQLLAADLDGERESYHIRRERTSMEPADFELNLEDMDEVRRWLSDRWQGPGSEALAHLLEKILQLAPHFDSVEEVEDVSPDMYVMF